MHCDRITDRDGIYFSLIIVKDFAHDKCQLSITIISIQKDFIVRGPFTLFNLLYYTRDISVFSKIFLYVFLGRVSGDTLNQLLSCKG